MVARYSNDRLSGNFILKEDDFIFYAVHGGWSVGEGWEKYLLSICLLAYDKVLSFL